ncbi:hypothetical protein MMC22_001758 [Lobaria immixta]|nr:hypothetical protein [Lobaria immixta]
MSLQTSSSSGLLSLPTEIKQKILSHLLVSQKPIKYHRSSTGSCWEIPKDTCGNILFTCAAMLDLGADTVFRQNAFAFNSPAEVHAFLELPQTAIVQSIVLRHQRREQLCLVQLSTRHRHGSRPVLQPRFRSPHHPVGRGRFEPLVPPLDGQQDPRRHDHGRLRRLDRTASPPSHLDTPWHAERFRCAGAWSRTPLLALALDAALEYTILNRDVAAFEQFKLILSRQ